jgi:hypothetical protein
LFDRLGISAEIWCRLVKDFGKLFSVIVGQLQRIDEHRSQGTSRRYRTRQETRELLATAQADLSSIRHCILRHAAALAPAICSSAMQINGNPTALHHNAHPQNSWNDQRRDNEPNDE